MIDETITRLRDQASTFKLVGGAAEFDAATQSNPKAAPAAYVLRFADRGHPQEVYGPPDQRVDAEIGVVYAVRNLTDPRGEAAGVDMEAVRAAGRAALLGWFPAGCDPLQFGAGNLLAFKDGYMWWQDSYRTRYTMTN